MLKFVRQILPPRFLLHWLLMLGYVLRRFADSMVELKYW